MKIRISKIKNKKVKDAIVFNIQVKPLLEALSNTTLAAGTITNPLPADGFIKLNQPDFTIFNPGNVIKIKFSSKNKKELKGILFSVVYCKVENVGKVFNEAVLTTFDFWNVIFNTDSKNIVLPPDGNLYIIPNAKNVCRIRVQNGNSDKKDITSYLSYNIVFSVTFKKKKYYLKIDPLLKISSNPPK